MRLDFFCDDFLSMGSWAGGFRGRFRGHVLLSFFGCAAAGRGRGLVRWEIVRFVVNRLAPADFPFSRLSRPPVGPFGVRRQSARYIVTPGRVGGRLVKSTGKVSDSLK